MNCTDAPNRHPVSALNYCERRILRHSEGDFPVFCRKNLQRAFTVFNPQKLGMEAISCVEFANSSFARASRTDCISCRMECPRICRNRISAMRREHLNVAVTSLAVRRSQALDSVGTLAEVPNFMVPKQCRNLS